MNRATSRENQGLAAAVGAPAHWHQALSSPLSLQDPQPSTQGPLWISPGGRGGGVCSLPRGMSSGLAQSKRVLSTVRAPGQGQHPGPAATPGRPPAADGRGEGSGSPAPILSSLACGNSRRHLHSWARGHTSVTHTVVPTHAVVPAPSTLPPHTLMFTLVCTLLPLRACSALPPPQECAYPQAHAHAHVLVLCPPACGHIHTPMRPPCSPIQHPHAHTPPRHLLTPPGHRHALSRRRHAHAHPGHLRLSNSPAHSPHPLTPLLHTLEQHCGSLLPTLPLYPPPWAHARIRVSLCAFAGHTRAHVCTLQRSLPLRSSTRPHCTVSHTARNRNPEDAKGSARRGVCVAS